MGQNLEELFDVVDERDQVTGQLARREVHRLRLRHRAVHLFVVNHAAQVFLHQRSRTKDLHPNLWNSSAAGHVGAGEDYDGTAVRELDEELGVTPLLAPEPLFKVDACEQTGDEFVWVYRVMSEGPFHLHPDEIQQGAWFTPAEIDRWVARRPEEFAPSFRFLWPMARPYLSRR